MTLSNSISHPIVFLALCLFHFPAYGQTSDRNVKSAQIGFCENCTDTEVINLVKSWSKPHSNPTQCTGGLGVGDCQLNDDNLEVHWFYVIDTANNKKYKYVANVYPFTEVLIPQSNYLAKDDISFMESVEQYFKRLNVAIDDMQTVSHQFLPASLLNSNLYGTSIGVDNNLSSTQSSDPGLEINCALKENQSQFYGLFVNDRSGLYDLKKRANDFFKNNFDEVASWDFSATLALDGVLKRIMAQGEVGMKRTEKEPVIPQIYVVELNGGQGGRIVFDIAFPKKGIVSTAIMKFNEEWSQDAQGQTINQSIARLKEGRVGFIKNPCDAQALAKLAVQNGYAPSSSAGGGGAGVIGEDWAPGNQLPYYYTEARYIYTVIRQPDGSTYIDVQTQFQEKVTRIGCD
ncbi:hypothetical protein [Pseudoalteromonas sp. T1lg88]|uniref:hypothetical protein n=1 Tax=Pseudoalteromonas sp. T1lg88 TaxID=2077104 RepID=UPI000CF70EA7|nr:hypothetical protein [Pseudoalteromonas sp. T1lg88]